MDVNLRKTATDTAYVFVGVGVLGFQQAQVKRRDAVAKVSTIGKDARTSVSAQTDTILAKAMGCAANISDLGTTVSGTVSNLGSTVGGTVSGSVGGLGSSVTSSVGSTVGTHPRRRQHPGEGRRQRRQDRRPAGVGRAGRR